MTSTEPPAAISRQLAQTPQGWSVGPLIAVQAAGDDARGGGFAGAALAGKDVAVRDAVLRDGVPQSGLDVLLVEHVVEGLRPVFRAMTWYMGSWSEAAVELICQAPGNPRHTG